MYNEKTSLYIDTFCVEILQTPSKIVYYIVICLCPLNISTLKTLLLCSLENHVNDIILAHEKHSSSNDYIVPIYTRAVNIMH